MLLISTSSAEDKYSKFIWIGDDLTEALYLGFTEVDKSALPKKAVLLIGHNKSFEKHFEYDMPV